MNKEKEDQQQMGDQQSLIDDAGGSEANDVDHAFEEALHSDEEEQLVDDE